MERREEMKRMRERIGYTQQDLADVLCLNVRTVQNWEQRDASDCVYRLFKAWFEAYTIEGTNI